MHLCLGLLFYELIMFQMILGLSWVLCVQLRKSSKFVVEGKVVRLAKPLQQGV